MVDTQEVKQAADKAVKATKDAAVKVVDWRDKSVNFASAHPKTTLLLLGVSAVANIYLLLKVLFHG